MAEANQGQAQAQGQNQGQNQQGQQGQAQGQQQDQQQAQGQQQPQEPEWLSYVPEAKREDARKGWLMESDYRKKTTTLAEEKKAFDDEKQKWTQSNGDLQKNYQELQKWYTEQYLPFAQKIQPYWQQVESIMSGQNGQNGQIQDQGQQQQHQNGQVQNQQYFQNWDLLPPEQQAERMGQFLGQNVVNTQLQQMKDEFNKNLQAREQYYQNYLNIFTDAVMKANQTPGFDIPKYINTALQYKYGQVDPLKAAYNDVTMNSNQEKLQQEWYAKGREEAQQELTNQNQNQGALQNSMVPVFKQAPMNREQVREVARQKAQEKGWGF